MEGTAKAKAQRCGPNREVQIPGRCARRADRTHEAGGGAYAGSPGLIRGSRGF